MNDNGPRSGSGPVRTTLPSPGGRGPTLLRHTVTLGRRPHASPRRRDDGFGLRALFVFLLLWTAPVAACGGGWAPMVFTSPTSSEEGDDKKDTKNNFYRIDRGVTYDMFNDKKLQPVIQRILANGNRRLDREDQDDSEKAESDSTRSGSDERDSKKQDKPKKTGAQVLKVKNLH